jgi:hypothetical protein
MHALEGILTRYGLGSLVTVGGSSIGANNAAFFACGKLAELRAVYTALQQKDDRMPWDGISGITKLAILDPKNDGGVFSEAPLRKLWEQHLDLANVVVPTMFGATDAATETHENLWVYPGGRQVEGQICAKNTGEFFDFAQASTAIFGVFALAPKIRGRRFGDGGHRQAIPDLPSDLGKGDRVHILLCNPIPPGTPISKHVPSNPDPDGWCDGLGLTLKMLEDAIISRDIARWIGIARVTGAEILVHAPPRSTGSLLKSDAALMADRDAQGLEAWIHPVSL